MSYPMRLPLSANRPMSFLFFIKTKLIVIKSEMSLLSEISFKKSRIVI